MIKEKGLTLNIVLMSLIGLLTLLLLFMSITRAVGLREAKAAVKEKSEAYSLLSDKLTHLKLLKNEEAVLKRKLTVLEKAIPASEKESSLVSLINGLSLDSGIHFVQIQFKESLETGGVVEMPVQLIFNASYNGLVHFLDQIEEGQRLIRLDDIQIFKTDSQTGLLRIEISASAFTR